ncbi:hypothetical protein BGZ96_006142 [Linnemannia gamsii]|uniref:C2H2-type domain-containing protein n=1 Tax=Linnemannia gamsii TaxID=64522 RepID=A0ABQ7K3V3_9FUNG|nr:hypothetical protein BGZ96_006142 [Linnemannia gamsii]
MSTSTAKKKPRNQGSTAGDAAGYQDSFQTMVTDPSDAKPGPRKTATKKTTGSSPPRAAEGDTQPQRDFKFVVEGQEKAKAAKPVAFEVLPPFQLKSPAQPQSPSQDTPGDESMDQDAPESSPTPDFERNADGKFRCSWPRCGKEFTVASRLTTHFRIHSGKPPYLCGYKDCQKAFHTSSSLSHHRVVHTDQGLRPYICRHNRCGATYTQLARLITHQRTTHSGMILFIPQESSSTNSSPQSLSQTASTTTTPSGNTPDDPFPSLSQTTVPSGYDTTLVPVSAAGISLESNNSTPRPGTPLNMNDPNRNSAEASVDERDKDKGLSTSKKEKTTARTSISVPQQSMPPSKRPIVEQQRSHTASPTPHPAGSGNNNTLTNGAPRTVSAQGYHSDDSSRGMGSSVYDGARDAHQENGQEPEEENDEEETDEMRQRREAALTMASFKDVVRVEQSQQQQHQPQPSGHAPAPPPPAGYYSQKQQPHGGQPYQSNDFRNSSNMYPAGPSPFHNNSHPPSHHLPTTEQSHHHHVAYPPQQQQQQSVQKQPQQLQQQQQQQLYSDNSGNKYWNDSNPNPNSNLNNDNNDNNEHGGVTLSRGTMSGPGGFSNPNYMMHQGARRLNPMAVMDGSPPHPGGDKRNTPYDQQDMFAVAGSGVPIKSSAFGGNPYARQHPQSSQQQHGALPSPFNRPC